MATKEGQKGPEDDDLPQPDADRDGFSETCDCDGGGGASVPDTSIFEMDNRGAGAQQLSDLTGDLFDVPLPVLRGAFGLKDAGSSPDAGSESHNDAGRTDLHDDAGRDLHDAGSPADAGSEICDSTDNDCNGIAPELLENEDLRALLEALSPPTDVDNSGQSCSECPDRERCQGNFVFNLVGGRVGQPVVIGMVVDGIPIDPEALGDLFEKARVTGVSPFLEGEPTQPFGPRSSGKEEVVIDVPSSRRSQPDDHFTEREPADTLAGERLSLELSANLTVAVVLRKIENALRKFWEIITKER